jgi:hypothetical protein
MITIASEVVRGLTKYRKSNTNKKFTFFAHRSCRMYTSLCFRNMFSIFFLLAFVHFGSAIVALNTYFRAIVTLGYVHFSNFQL